ncbi:hypothetical protein KY285_006544 [Solanum tuberosum]|nr:hypothetical protein KY289_006454 [Solanum tuberosum]KAH0753396.1 hypothetical protein KY285_006544 [Solanum tuberosum]
MKYFLAARSLKEEPSYAKVKKGTSNEVGRKIGSISSYPDWVRCRASHMQARIMSLPLLIVGARHNNNKSSVIPQVGSEEGDLYVDLMKIARAR